MRNTLEEFINLTYGSRVKCANITYSFPAENTTKELKLILGYSQAQWEQFCKELDFNYDSAPGLQSLHGTIWMADDSWFERVSYSNAWFERESKRIPNDAPIKNFEWWEYYKVPPIPEDLQVWNFEASPEERKFNDDLWATI